MLSNRFLLACVAIWWVTRAAASAAGDDVASEPTPRPYVEPAAGVLATLRDVHDLGRPARDEDVRALREFGRAHPNDPEALFHLALLVKDGRVKVGGKDYITLLKESSRRGHLPAQSALGVTYLNGQGVAEDRIEGERLLRDAYDLGDADAAKYLGSGYVDGQGGWGTDPVKAEQFLEEAVRRGSRHANLGLVFARQRQGDGPGSVRALQSGAEAGVVQCQAALSKLYARGEHVARDPAKAVQWMEQAAEGGDVGMQRELGKMLLAGVPPV